MREDIKTLIQMIADLYMGDEIDTEEFEEILKRNNFQFEDCTLIDLEEEE